MTEQDKDRELVVRLSREDLAGLAPGSGLRWEISFGDTTVVIVPPPKDECYCGTVNYVHEFGSPGCEYRDHHCESCHDEVQCTDASCGFDPVKQATEREERLSKPVAMEVS